MAILTIIFIVVIVVSIFPTIPLFRDEIEPKKDAIRKIGYIKQVGLFGLVVGVLGQLIGLFEAFEAIELAGDITLAMVAGGIRVSMITTLYGFLIFVFSFLIWAGFIFKLR